jgi:ankyrin repeat protein
VPAEPGLAAPSFRAPIDAYEREASALYEKLAAGDDAAKWRFKWLHPRFRHAHVNEVRPETLDLTDARLVVAHDHAFESWDDLAAFTRDVSHDGPAATFETAADAVVSGDLDTLRDLLRRHPGLAKARSPRRHRATLLHYVAANGVEDVRQKTPPNAVEVAKLLLDAGAEVDALADMYDEQCSTMSMLVSSEHPAKAGVQVELAETLLARGAAPDGVGSKWQSHVMTALAFGYLDTARALAAHAGATLDLPAVAGLGRADEVARLLPDADAETRHAALALAATHGHADVVQLLLDAGEDPNRYNPEGLHSHSTPLHQAALEGHADVVRLLVDRGARLDVRDTLYDGTPLDWALHGARVDVAAFLRSVGTAEA